jgi:hypothetical protein
MRISGSAVDGHVPARIQFLTEVLRLPGRFGSNISSATTTGPSAWIGCLAALSPSRAQAGRRGRIKSDRGQAALPKR